MPYQRLLSPVGPGWMENANGSISIQWTQGDVLPQQLIDLLSDSTSTHATCTSKSCCNNDCSVEEEVDEEFNEFEEDCEVDNIIDIVFASEEDDCDV